VVAGLLALAMTAATAGGAGAHVVYQSGELWGSGNKCLYGYSETSHGGGGGYVKVYDLTSQGDPFRAVCILPWQRPAGYLRIKYYFFKWTGSSWAVCRQVGEWRYNQSSASKLTLTWNFGSSPPCGRGYYGTQSYHGVRYNGAWHGDVLWSGSHYLPA
jgi:hypothetical protein